MSDFILQKATGKYIIVEPFEKSSVLRAEEIATVFKVVSVGDCDPIVRDYLNPDDLIIVTPNSVEKTRMGHKEVYYVRDTDVVATINNA